MPEQESVGDIEVGLTGDAGKVVMTASILNEHAVNEIGADCSGDGSDQRLVPQEHIVAAAGATNAASVEGAADKLVQVAAIFNAVTQGEVIVGVDLVVDFDDAVIVVFRFQDGIEKSAAGKRRALSDWNVTALRWQPEQSFGAVDKVRIRGVGSIQQGDGLKICGGIGGTFAAPLAFVVGKKEGLIFIDGAAQSSPN